MTTKCPKCGSPALSSDYQRAFECGTVGDRRGTLHHTTTCRYFSEFRKPLDAYIKRLEEAGDKMASVADAADDDIGQHLQVANYNLHGLINTGEKIDPPNPPHTIHHAGIDASVVVRQAIRNARIEWKRAKEAKP